MPVVFTSTLPLHTREGDRQPPFQVELVEGVTQSPQTLLDHQVSEENGALTVRWDYLVQAFPPGVIEEMFDAYTQLLEQLATDEQSWRRASRQSLAPAHQVERRLVYNQTSGPLPAQLLHQPFQSQARLNPMAPAIFSDRRSMSYGRLQGEVTLLAQRLSGFDLKAGELVAVVMEKGWEQVVAALGILEAGGAYLPVDARLPAARRNHLLKATGVRVALVQPWRAEGLESWPEDVEFWSVEEQSEEQSQSAYDRGPLPARQGLRELAYVIYTSGSTGRPKGVMMEHLGAQNTVEEVNRRYGVGKEDRVLCLSSLSFDLSVYDIFGLLGAGGALVIPGAESERDPGEWVRLMSEGKVTIWNSVPALMEMCEEWLRGRGERFGEELRLVLMSGDWINVSLPERVKELSRKDVEVVSLGGATEGGIWSIWHEIGEVREEWRSIPYGEPMKNQRMYVLNEELENSPEWVTGELYIGGEGLARGYYGDERQTKERFIESPWGERLYRTGDLGRYRREGWIEFLGREDTQVKVQGHRIELGEIESALMEMEEVKEAVVTVAGAAGNARRLIAYVTLHQNAAPSPNASFTSAPARGSVVANGSSNGAALLNIEEREAFKKSDPGVRSFPSTCHSISLSFSEEDQEIGELYFRRRSQRDFRQEPIPMEIFSAFLSSLRRIKLNGQPKYRYSSAGGLYPVQVYLYIKPGGIEGIEGGVYYYQPVEHRLIKLAEGEVLNENLHWPSNRQAFKQSAFSLFLAADMNAVKSMYGGAAHNFSLLEAGVMTHLLETEAVRYGIGLCQIGSLDFDSVRSSFQLEDGHNLLHTLVGGLAIKTRFQARVEIPGREIEKAASTNGKREPMQELTSGRRSVKAEDLRLFLSRKLPEALVPAQIVFMDRLPINANGKIDRRRLPAPEEVPDHELREFAPPQNALQQVIADALQKELQLERLSVKDNFFDLGATSLSLVKVHHQLRQALKEEIPIIALFRFPTVEALARQLQKREPAPEAEEDFSARAAMRRKRLQHRRRRQERND
jgi:amino acid adenylation domain-containing protein